MENEITVGQVPDILNGAEVVFTCDKASEGIHNDDINALFVATKNGEYIAIWGISGTVPYNGKPATRLT